jgi:hypothetical protein
MKAISSRNLLAAPLETVEEKPIQTRLSGLLENDSKSKPSVSESSISCNESDLDSGARKDKPKPTQKLNPLMRKDSMSSKSLASKMVRFKSEKNLAVNTQIPKKKPSM